MLTPIGWGQEGGGRGGWEDEEEEEKETGEEEVQEHNCYKKTPTFWQYTREHSLGPLRLDRQRPPALCIPVPDKYLLASNTWQTARRYILAARLTCRRWGAVERYSTSLFYYQHMFVWVGSVPYRSCRTSRSGISGGILSIYYVMALPAELWGGVKHRPITQPRVFLITLFPPPPSLNGGIFWGVGTAYIGPYADLPASFQYLGNQGDTCAQGSTRKRFFL